MEANFNTALSDLNALETDLQRQLDAVGRAKSALTEVSNGNGQTTPAAPSGASGDTRRGPGRPAGSTTSRRSGGGTRADQAVSLIERNPGITIPDLAKSMGIQPNYLYRVVPTLEKEGRVKKEGAGFVAISA